jgi:hypothetical protein
MPFDKAMLDRATMNFTYVRACFLTGVAALFLPHASLLGADLQRLTPELVLSLRSAADVALSPDGRDVVYRIDRPRNAQESRGRDGRIATQADGSRVRCSFAALVTRRQTNCVDRA